MTVQSFTIPDTSDGGAALLAWSATMRRNTPVVGDQYGVYHLFRYDDVQRAMTDPALFSSDITKVGTAGAPVSPEILTMLDPPVHRKLRTLVSQAFTPKIVAALEPDVQDLADSLLDRVDPDDFDLVRDLGYPLPALVIAKLLDIPDTDLPLFRSWSERMLSMQFEDDDLLSMQFTDEQDPEFDRLVTEPLAEMHTYLLEHCAARRAAPGVDLMSRLVTAEVDGDVLTDNQVVEFSRLLLMAGHVSTSMMLGNAVLCLDQNSAVYRQIRDDRALIPGFIEEVLRYRSPINFVSRVTTDEVELSGTVVPPHTMVIPWLLSANHDDTRFADPERFDIHRRTQHVGFGHGIHFCLGAPLGRLEGGIALNTLLDRYAGLRVAPDAAISFHRKGLLGPKNLPIEVS